jgi:hypothetical protein
VAALGLPTLFVMEGGYAVGDIGTNVANAGKLSRGWRGAVRRPVGFGIWSSYGLALIAPTAAQHAGRSGQGARADRAVLSAGRAVCMAFTATSYAVMVREVRSAGSLYGFARAALGPFAGFMGGWMILLDYLMIPSLVYVIMAVALGQLMPEVDRAVWIVALLGFTTAVNWFGIRSTSAFNAVSVIAQIAVMVAAGDGRRAVPGADPCLSPAPVWADPLPWQGVLAGTSVCVLSFRLRRGLHAGRDTADRSGRTLGRAILAVLARWPRCSSGCPPGAGQCHGRPPSPAWIAAHYELAGAMLGAWARPGWPGSLRWSWAYQCPADAGGRGPRAYAMGRDGQVPTVFARLHPHNTPWVAMLATAALSLVVALVFLRCAGFPWRPWSISAR